VAFRCAPLIGPASGPVLVVQRAQTQTAPEHCGGLCLGSLRDQAAFGGISDALRASSLFFVPPL